MQTYSAVQSAALLGKKSSAELPKEWRNLFDWFEQHPKETMTITADSREEAIALRFRFYMMRRRLQDPNRNYPNTYRRKARMDGNNVLLSIHYNINDLVDKAVDKALTLKQTESAQ